jgi:hypothetical protein
MKSIRSRVSLVLAALPALVLAAGLAAAVWAQASGRTAAATKRPQAGPHPALDQLRFFAGTWQCTGTSHAQGKTHPTSARATAAWTRGGSMLSIRYQELKSEANPTPLNAVEHLSYSQERRKLVAGQSDSFGRRGSHTTAGWEGNKLVWTGEAHQAGMKMASRETFVRNGDDEFSHLGEFQVNGTWTRQVEETCRRSSRQ